MQFAFLGRDMAWLHELWPTSFANPYAAMLLFGVVPLFLGWQRLQPLINFLNIGSQMKLPRSTLSKKIVGLSIGVCFINLVLIVMGPQRPAAKTKEIKQFIALGILIDTSGSMGDPIEEPELLAYAQAEAKRMGADKVRKIDAARLATAQSIRRRSRPLADGESEPHMLDLVALFTFGNAIYKVCALTDSTNLLLDELNNVGRITSEGTNFEGPNGLTVQVGCFQGLIDHFRYMKELFKQKGAEFPTSLVGYFVTDGQSSISAPRMAELRTEISELDLYINVLAVGSDWTKKPEAGKPDATADIRALVDGINQDAKKKEVDCRAKLGLPAMTPAEEADPLLVHARIIVITDSKQMREAFSFLDNLHPTSVTYEHEMGFRQEPALFAMLALAFFTFSLMAALKVGRRI